MGDAASTACPGKRLPYPTKLLDSRDIAIEPDQVHRLDKQGRLPWRGRKLLVSSALGYEYVLVDRAAE
jgi:hypothetical protein